MWQTSKVSQKPLYVDVIAVFLYLFMQKKLFKGWNKGQKRSHFFQLILLGFLEPETLASHFII